MYSYIQRQSIICINKEGQILLEWVVGDCRGQPSNPGLRWSASYFKISCHTGQIRGHGKEKMKRVLWPQGFEEWRKSFITICELQPVQEGRTDRVIQGLVVTVWYICLPKSCSIPCLLSCSNARNRFTSEGSTATRQCSEEGAKRQTRVFPVPRCCPYAQHPPQASCPHQNFMSGPFLPSAVS